MDVLRRYVPLAPVPGAVLAAIMYGADPSFEDGFASPHLWSNVGVIAGWWMVLAGLVVIASNQITRWMGLIAAASYLAGSTQGSAGALLFVLGFLVTAAMALVVTTTYAVNRYGVRGRATTAAALIAIGVAALLSFGYPDSLYLDNPATQVWAALVVSPFAVAFGALWLRLDRPPGSDLSRAGEPASFTRRFVSGFVSWVIFGVATGTLDAAAGPALGPFAYPIAVLVLQVMPTALWGRTLGQLSTGLRVVRVDTAGQPGWLRSLVRFAVFQAVPLLGLIYFLAWFLRLRIGLGASAPSRLAWDRASGTAVLRVPRDRALEPAGQT